MIFYNEKTHYLEQFKEYLMSQIVECKDKKEILIPMTLLKSVGQKYDYKCTIECEELYNLDNNDEFNIKTEVLIFTM